MQAVGRFFRSFLAPKTPLLRALCPYGKIDVSKEKIIERLKLAASTYIANDAILSSVTALISGKKPEDLPLLSVESQSEKTGVMKLGGEIRELINSTNDPVLTEHMKSLSNYLNKISNNNRSLLIFCGPSSVGKDCVASIVKGRLLTSSIEIDYLDKYTTRSRRGTEGKDTSNIGSHSIEPSSNYSYIESHKEFDRVDDAVLPYSLYGFKYGFSKSHLSSDNEDADSLACIYGKLENISKFRNAVEGEYYRRTYAVLLTATENYLMDRLTKRHSLTPEEVFARMKVLRGQLDYVRQNKDEVENNFDLVVDNGNDTAINSTAEAVLQGLKQNVPNMA